MDRKSRKAELSDKTNCKVNNVDNLKHFIKVKDGGDLKNYNNVKDNNDLQNTNKSKDKDHSKNNSISFSDSKHNRGKKLSDMKMNDKYTSDISHCNTMRDISDLKNYNKLKKYNDLKDINKTKDKDDSENNSKVFSDSKHNRGNNLTDSKTNDSINMSNCNKMRDRGDLKIVIKPMEYRMKKDEVKNPNIINPDGDTKKNSVNQRFKINDTTKQSVDTKSESLKAMWNKRTVVRNAQALATLDLKRIRERYTMKLRNPNRSTIPAKKDDNNKVDSTKTELKNVHIESTIKSGSLCSQTKEQEKAPNLSHFPQKTHDSPRIGKKTQDLTLIIQNEQDLFPVAQNTQDLLKMAPKSHDFPHLGTKGKETKRKPVIRTITTKNGSTRIYKAVTFEERKVKPASLQINIPNDPFLKSNSTKSSEVNSLKSKVTASKVSVKEKNATPKKYPRKRDKKRRRQLPSPDCSIHDIDSNRSPLTEVAKWAPTSITPHTKPYYEAWVDTTLTAVSKSDKIKMEKMMRCLKQGLERPDTPELFYSNYADERYAGRIKIRHPR